jgi:hypothetical protein
MGQEAGAGAGAGGRSRSRRQEQEAESFVIGHLTFFICHLATVSGPFISGPLSVVRCLLSAAFDHSMKCQFLRTTYN